MDDQLVINRPVVSDIESHIEKTKYLVVGIKDNCYCIPLAQVQEIISPTTITPIPYVDKSVLGVINLRGRIVTIVDIRAKVSTHGLDFMPKKTVFIILETVSGSVGGIVDEVFDVISLSHDEINTDVDFQGEIDRKYINGVAKDVNNNLVMLLNVARLTHIGNIYKRTL